MENLNSVCFVNKISKIEPIDGADKIELAHVNGWTSVVQKGIHNVGDLVICTTTDAVIPVELSDKWNVTSYLRKGQRVRTVRLKGVYSECILIPAKFGWREGQDLMEVLGVFKYEPPVKQVQLSSGRKIKYKNNPAFEVYYKFPNQKNVPNMFNEPDEVVITRKMHGTNARYGIVKKTRLSLFDRIRKFFGNEWIGYEYVYGSHNVEKGSDSQGFYDTDVWADVAKSYGIKEKLWNWVKENYTPREFGSGIVIYGEIVGQGIQKNYDYNLSHHALFLFDIMGNQKYLSHEHFNMVSNQLNICQNVEELHIGKWNKEIQDSFVFNNFIKSTKIPHEGVVVKSIDGDRRKISKVINPEYLTYGEKHGTTDSH